MGTKNVQTVDSEYLGIPNDLYPAYRKETTSYIPTQNQSAPLSIDVKPTIVPLPSGPIPNDTITDSDRCDTAQENPTFRSRFRTQVQQSYTPAPVRLPEVPRYTTQFSTIGNAFVPVGQPQISEYQYEDLNDLTSCIDAI
ncbi:unnamed protein product [Strongylus vulgaris]|uniref:Uncharacterized protein n=1 Tax=Strongylus vulgaris TaxID=40348 RepID=A0A3P7IQA1_STRVU|nr:unnamed protein product [Strongylus vulgaris]